MKTARDIGLLFQRYLTQLLRYPVWLVVGFSTPILYLALFTPLLQHLSGVPGLPTASSIALALVTREISGFAIINALNLPVLLLAGVLLPMSLGPPWVRILAYLDPLYYLVQASRVLASGTLAGVAVWQAFAVLAPLCALVLTWATRVIRRAVA